MRKVINKERKKKEKDNNDEVSKVKGACVKPRRGRPRINTSLIDTDSIIRESKDIGIESNFVPKAMKNIRFSNNPLKAWNNTLSKFCPSPKKECLSPIKQQIECHLEPTHFESNDKKSKLAKIFKIDGVRINGFTWCLSMSEQFYYDNTLSFVSKYRKDIKSICKVIKANFSKTNIKKLRSEWLNLIVLGEGSFGKVYKVTEKSTKLIYAIKYINETRSRNIIQHYDYILTYLTERNYLMDVRNSPLMVKFYFGFKYNKLNGLFLVFEYCIGDLHQFNNKLLELTKIDYVDIFLNNKKFNFDCFLEQMNTKVEFDLQLVITVFIFEGFCMLDYLAKCNIVHRDIKPENIMISNNLHLKMADFGLVYNSRFITNVSQVQLVKHKDINKVEDQEYLDEIHGTNFYFDLELLYHKGDAIKNDEFKFFDNKQLVSNTLKTSGFSSNFLSDLWAMGLTCLAIVQCGHEIYDVEGLEVCQIKTLNLHFQKTSVFSSLEIFWIKNNLEKYFIKCLHKLYNGSYFAELIDFMITIFRPRKIRAKDFVKGKEVLKYNDKSYEYYLDIEKVGNLGLFKTQNLNSNNVFLTQMPDGIRDLLGKKEEKPIFKTFGHMLDDMVKKLPKKNQRVIQVTPGTEITLI